MRRALVTAAAATVLGLCTALTATPALAQSVDVELDPSTASPGDPVSIMSSCETGRAESDAFGTTTLDGGLVGNERFASAGTSTVFSGTPSGTYDVVVTCSNGETGTATLVVTSGGIPAGDGAEAGGMQWPMIAGGAGLIGLAGLAITVSGRRNRSVA